MGTVNLRISYTSWVTSRCAACGCRFRLRTDGEAQGTGKTVKKATQNARNRADEAVANASVRCLCPQCSFAPANSVERERRATHLQACALVFGVSLVAMPSSVVSEDAPFWILGVGSCIAFALHQFAARLRSKVPTEGDAASSARAVAEGRAEVLSSGVEGRGPLPGPLNRAAGFVLRVAMLTSVLFSFVTAAFPLTMRARNDHMRPSVAGPGDTVRITLPDTIPAVGDYWRGEIRTFDLLNQEDVGSLKLSVITETFWKDQYSQIHMRGGYTNVWLQVVIPDDPAFANKILHIHVRMEVFYPKEVFVNNFVTTSKVVDREIRLELSSRGAGRIEQKTRGAALLYILCGIGCGLGLAFLAWIREPEQPAVGEIEVTAILVPDREPQVPPEAAGAPDTAPDGTA